MHSIIEDQTNSNSTDKYNGNNNNNKNNTSLVAAGHNEQQSNNILENCNNNNNNNNNSMDVHHRTSFNGNIICSSSKSSSSRSKCCNNNESNKNCSTHEQEHPDGSRTIPTNKNSMYDRIPKQHPKHHPINSDNDNDSYKSKYVTWTSKITTVRWLLVGAVLMIILFIVVLTVVSIDTNNPNNYNNNNNNYNDNNISNNYYYYTRIQMDRVIVQVPNLWTTLKQSSVTIVVPKFVLIVINNIIHQQRKQQKKLYDCYDQTLDFMNNFVQRRQRIRQRQRQRRLVGNQVEPTKPVPLKILYIVTTLAEYNTGDRSTIRGSDRLQETTIPVLSESVHSMMNSGYTVDVYMVCHYVLKPEREALIRSALPNNVGLEIWNDATPLGYDTSKEPLLFDKLINRTLHLARQHRFVIKDKILQYDIFVNFEDDMYITGHHVTHYRAVTNELQRLYTNAPNDNGIKSSSDAIRNFYGPMTKNQLQRTIPGFIRVEVLVNETYFSAQNSTGPIPIDLDFGPSYAGDSSSSSHVGTIDSSICCNLSAAAVTTNRPQSPTPDKIMIWETNIKPLGVRKMPNDSWLDWTLLQRGPNQQELNPSTDIIGDYWINRNDTYYPKMKRPAPQEFKYINNQGGWMATKKQLLQWHTDICPGGFLPPYEKPHYNYDGLDMRNVEWYSGGMQLTTVRHACNMQRIILLHPTNFSKSLLYHTANNKQKQLSYKKEEFFTKANTLLGQLNTIKKQAEKEIQ